MLVEERREFSFCENILLEKMFQYFKDLSNNNNKKVKLLIKTNTFTHKIWKYQNESETVTVSKLKEKTYEI